MPSWRRRATSTRWRRKSRRLISRGSRPGPDERELSARGFSAETIAAALAEADSSGEEKSLERAFAKLWASSAGTPRQRRRQRVWSALVRRGFAAARVSEIMKGSHDDDEIDRG